jgi:NRAMP (natural resistance-associated macrophage protein)-like metal ion transporter
MLKNKSGFIVAAAFVGPGTVTTASLAGANFGFHLAWALVFSVIATIVLQDMAVRLGIATRQGLGHAVRNLLPNKTASLFMGLLIVLAIGVGNAAYESGNLTGAAIGLNSLLPWSTAAWSLLIGSLASLLLWLGRYKVIEGVLIGLVGIMALVFTVTFAVSSPDWGSLVSQLFAAKMDSETITPVLALIGTTIVPYNLFLHASLVAEQQQQDPSLKMADFRSQSIFAISVGGLITLVIMATAMQAFFTTQETLDASNIGRQLAPLLGEHSELFFAIGIFSAGLTSAITAPLAAAYAICGVFNRPANAKDPLFRGTWISIIVLGVGFAVIEIKPLLAILVAQATNGLLLPIIALFLLIIMNTHPNLGRHKNGLMSNLLGAGVIVLVTLLCVIKLSNL